MRKVLFIAYLYPPCNASGSKRLAGIAKYLPKYAWEPLILTRQWTPQNCAYDPYFIKNLPAFETFPCEETPSKRTIANALLRKIMTALEPTKTPSSWHDNAKTEINNICATQKIDAIFASYAPYAPIELAAYASERFNVPWIADFRDVVDQAWMTHKTLRLLMMRHEIQLMRNCSEVITVSEGLAKSLETRHNRAIHVIEHGFDPEETNLSDTSNREKFTITYTGTVNSRQTNPFVLFDALKKLIDKELIISEDIVVNFYKKHINEDDYSIEKASQYYPFLKINSLIPRSEVLEVQRKSTILLHLTHPKEKGIMTGKIFEYLAAGRPILAIPNDHDCIEKLMNETNAGVCSSSIEEIEAQLLLWYKDWKLTGSVPYQGNMEAIMNYSFDRNAERLSELLNKATCAIRNI